jgi:hypothetical protein
MTPYCAYRWEIMHSMVQDLPWKLIVAQLDITFGWEILHSTVHDLPWKTDSCSAGHDMWMGNTALHGAWSSLKNWQLLSWPRNFLLSWNPKFVTAITEASHWILPWITSIQSMLSHCYFSNIIDFPKGLFPYVLPSELFNVFTSPCILYVLPISNFLI